MRKKGLFIKRSFTLLELILAIVVVGIISIPGGLVITGYIESAYSSGDLTKAINLARLEMENVSGLRYQDIINATFSNYGGYNYDLVRRVSEERFSSSGFLLEGLKRVVVEVKPHQKDKVLTFLVTFVENNGF